MVNMPGPLFNANDVWHATQVVSAGKVPNAGAPVREAGGPVENAPTATPKKQYVTAAKPNSPVVSNFNDLVRTNIFPPVIQTGYFLRGLENRHTFALKGSLIFCHQDLEGG